MSFFQFHSKKTKTRDIPCDFCQTREGALVGKINYFDLGHYDMCQCPQCGLISTDPIPTSEVVQEGCSRLYSLQQSSETTQSILRGFSKSYRRGALFARQHLGAYTNPRILEIGAGDGYFSMGIAAQIPGAKVTLLDIVEDLVQYYSDHHSGAESICGEFPSALPEDRKFDVIIFRDLLEHTRKPYSFLEEVKKRLSPQGMAFFITPNGREDFWMIHQRFLHNEDPSLLLLNHFHYFLPETLKSMLDKARFEWSSGFKFGLKQHKKGLGWKTFNDFQTETVPETQNLEQQLSSTYWKHNPQDIRTGLLNNLGPISRTYSQLVDRENQKKPWLDAAGHEFFVLAGMGQAHLEDCPVGP